MDEERTRGYSGIVYKNVVRWFVMVVIGVITALIACTIDIAIEQFAYIKYGLIKKCIL